MMIGWPTTLLVGQLAQPTGMARVMRALAGRLGAHRRIHILAIDGFPGTNAADMHVEGCTVHGNPFSLDLFAEQELSRLCAELRPECVVLYHDPWHVPRLRQAVPAGPKVVAYCPLDGAIRNEKIVRGLRGLDGVAVPTAFAAGEFRAAAGRFGIEDDGIFSHRMAVLPHGMEKNGFHPLPGPERRGAARRALFPDRPDLWPGFWVANVNRNHSRKRLGLTLEGFAKFAAGKPANVRLYLHWGAERTGPDLPGLARDLGIEDRMVLPEHHEGIASTRLNLVYNAADVGINTALGEGWGLPAFEHAATHAPQIVPEHSACAELWQNAAVLLPVRRQVNPAGWVEGGEVHADDVAAALERLYGDPAWYGSVAQACLRVAADPVYGWPSIAVAWHRWLSDIAPARS